MATVLSEEQIRLNKALPDETGAERSEAAETDKDREVENGRRSNAVNILALSVSKIHLKMYFLTSIIPV